MQGRHFICRYSRCVLTGVLFLLAGGGLALSWPDSRPAATPAAELKALACFTGEGQLRVAVTVTGYPNRKPGEHLQVELLDPDGRVLKTARKPLLQQAPPGGYVVELPADRSKAERLTLRLRLGEQQKDVALAEVLLVKAHETTLVSSQEFYAGSRAALRCSIHGLRSAAETVPLAAAEVVVRLRAMDGKEHELASATTDHHGRADLQLTIPEVAEGTHTLEVQTRSALGQEKLQRSVLIRAPSKILLISDRPVYQPGQVIHLRALALRPIDFKPLEKVPLLFEIEDGKGNKVFKKSLETSTYGVAWADFQLADEVNEGDYRLRATLGKHSEEKAVLVKHYVLPRFKVKVAGDKRFYLPGETVKIDLQSDYFFGKPVANARVEIAASTFDVAFQEFHKEKGRTDDSGHFKVSIPLPKHFVGQPLQKGSGLVKFDVKVTDSADHTEAVVKNYTVSAQAIQVNLIAEGGRIVPDMENRIFVAAVYPDGTPAACEVKVWRGKKAEGDPLATVKTSTSGLGEFRITPASKELRAGEVRQESVELLGGRAITWSPAIVLDLAAEARDARGNHAHAALTLNSHPLGENILLRLNQAVYQGGDTMKVDVRTSAGMPTVYLDVVRGGQLLLTRWLDVKDGKAEYRFDLPQHVRGSLEIHAYQMLRSGEIIRDSRAVYVQPRQHLKIDVQSNKTIFLPGESGRLRFMVTDAKGKPAQAALSVLVVDEAVYALQENQPGLEKVYFALQEELLKPRVQAPSETLEQFKQLVRQVELSPEKQQVAEVLMTALKVQPPPRWEVNPAPEREKALRAQVQQIGAGLFNFALYDNAFLKPRAAKGAPEQTWDFAPGVLEAAIKSGHLTDGWLQDIMGGRLTLAGLQRLEKHFTAERLARVVSVQRIENLTSAVANYATENQDKFFRNGRWELTDGTLAEAAKAANLTEVALCDPWGRPFRIVERTSKGQSSQALPPFQSRQIVSAGPDGQVGTADDVRWTGDEPWQLSGVWWGEDDPLQGPRTRRPLDKAGRKPGPTTVALHRMARDLNGGGVNINGGFNFRGRHGVQQGFNGFNFNGFNGGINGINGINGGFNGFNLNGMNFQGGFRAGQYAPQGFGGGGGFGFNSGGFNFGGFNFGGFQGAQVRSYTSTPTVPPVADLRPLASGPAAPGMHVREYFPETLLWQPNLITDENGVADLAVNLADSITTWRLSATASSRLGALGSAESSLKVFQDFFVELDLPVALTQHDEVIFPVAVHNYLKVPQEVTISLKQEDWFELVDGRGLKRQLQLQAGEVTSVKYAIRTRRIGSLPLTVTARGSKMSDAVQRKVEVTPNGRKVETVVSDRLAGKVRHVFNVPQDAVPDAAKVLVRLYPGVMAQLVDGLEGMMNMPGGCFEQTSSSAYPNILIVEYLRKTKRQSPALMMKAEHYLSVGHQKLLTFERPGGGFDWWGSGEPLVWLSAYGLQEFSDMARVYPIDRAVIVRTQNWLLKQRGQDGTWANIGGTHGESIERMGHTKLLLTSYVAWSLLESGLPRDQMQASIDYIRNHAKEASENPYVLALAANALASFDAKDDSTLEVLRMLEKRRQLGPKGDSVCYPSEGRSLTYAHGDSLTVETTALAVLAMVKSGQFGASARMGLNYLIKTKGSGTWGSTSATILSLKALVAVQAGGAIKDRVGFTILVNGKESARGEVTADNADVMQAFDLKGVTGPGVNEVEIRPDGETALMYQIVGRYYLPWLEVPAAQTKAGFTLDVSYDRTKLSTHDLLHAKATVKYQGVAPANMVMLELGVAPGFTVDAGDFAEMVANKQISKFSVTSRQVILYLDGLRPGESRTFAYSLRARYPVRAQTPASVAYEYYTPTNRAAARPIALTVTDGK